MFNARLSTLCVHQRCPDNREDDVESPSGLSGVFQQKYLQLLRGSELSVHPGDLVVFRRRVAWDRPTTNSHKQSDLEIALASGSVHLVQPNFQGNSRPAIRARPASSVLALRLAGRWDSRFENLRFLSVEVEANRAACRGTCCHYRSFMEEGPKQTTTPDAHPDNHLRRVKWNNGYKVRVVGSSIAAIMAIHFPR